MLRHASLAAARERRAQVRAAAADEMAPARYDAYLDAVATFPTELPRAADGQPDWTRLPTEAIRVRRWGERRARLADVHPDQVVSCRAAFPRFLRVAYEIEDPWPAYVAESVAYLEHDGSRKLAGVMATVWEGDERRHAATFRALYRRLVGADPAPNPHRAGPVLDGPAAVERHLYSRLNAELGASAAYTVYASHARGDLRLAVENVAGDEFRHLALFWAAVRWRFGDAAPVRLFKWVHQLHRSASGHRRARTGLDRLRGEDLVVLAETAAAVSDQVRHLLAWDRTLTATRLQEVFGPVPALESREAEERRADRVPDLVARPRAVAR